MSESAGVFAFVFKDAGHFPNNPRLPVLVYRQVRLPTETGGTKELATWFENAWRSNGWQPAWRYGVYDFPHYHSTAHEVLGVYRGHASLRLGESVGATVDAVAGDLIVLPAGTAHQNLGASSDFHVVGGYPKGQSADLLTGQPGERPAADKRIERVPAPTGDPLYGKSGPLVEHWNLRA